MTIRNIVRIDEEKCYGCGLCVNACAEGAIKIVDGKAKLLSEFYCDGLGACIGHCPQDAITIEKREAAEFDEEATKAHLSKQKETQVQAAFASPGMSAKKLRETSKPRDSAQSTGEASELGHWPVQLKLVSTHAPYFAGADLLFVANCVPFAMADFHSRFLKDHSIAVGCPKLDDVEFYIDKLATILRVGKPGSLTVIHMEVPCCHGLPALRARQLPKTKLK